VGKRLRDIADENQVLCVTHLPQIASFARRHFSVFKEVANGRTETFVKQLTDAERVQELSRMLGGEKITETTRRHALEMLEYSRESRNKRSQQHNTGGRK
jgi:DNA repair protein RecN (Recombination protein N)